MEPSSPPPRAARASMPAAARLPPVAGRHVSRPSSVASPASAGVLAAWPPPGHPPPGAAGRTRASTCLVRLIFFRSRETSATYVQMGTSTRSRCSGARSPLSACGTHWEGRHVYMFSPPTPITGEVAGPSRTDREKRT
uniref:Uncharacterized protein n=1 Tax=Ananas comosus var. bracteatus TaxID=296719 RepID=A0A6V7QIF8_ANACO|nr:unnamed protein product [Ananas comosus var. bracteatus]